MNTVQKIFVAFTCMTSMAAMANDIKVVSGNEGEVTITEENKTVEVSILNTRNAYYTLFIFGTNGELVFEGNLGNDVSLGKVFDFKNAEKGTYTFKVVSNEGEEYQYDIKTGSMF